MPPPFFRITELGAVGDHFCCVCVCMYVCVCVCVCVCIYIYYILYIFPGGFLPLRIITSIVLTAAPISFVPFLREHSRIRDHSFLAFLKAHRSEGCCQDSRGEKV